jgi:hypothetical protein
LPQPRRKRCDRLTQHGVISSNDSATSTNDGVILNPASARVKDLARIVPVQGVDAEVRLTPPFAPVSFAPSELAVFRCLPRACALGCILAPLRG